MNRKKLAQTLIQPFAHVHSTLTALGFVQIDSRRGSVYELLFRDPVTDKEYPYRLFAHTHDNGRMSIDLDEACFVGKEEAPQAAQAAADEILAELVQYLENGPGRPRCTSLSDTMNGRMANNEAEVKRLGKTMAGMPTNTELKKSGMIPDPIQ